MQTGVRVSFQLLAQTPNEAAIEVLIAALDCAQQATRDNALQALLSRREEVAQREIFRRLPAMDEHTQEVLKRKPDWLVSLAAAGLRNPDPQMNQIACATILNFDLYEAMPALVAVLCNQEQGKGHSDLLAQTILQLTEQFYGQLSKPEGQRSRENLDSLRPWLTNGLEEAVKKYNAFQRREPLEAFLLVVKRKNEILRGILQQFHSELYQALVEVMKSSTRGGVVRLLLTFLQDEDPPMAIDEVFANRCDPKFVEHFLGAVAADLSPAATAALKRIQNLPWATPESELLRQLDGSKQAATVRLLAASAVERPKVLAVLRFFLQEGTPEGRRAAAAALAEFKGPEADELALACLEDADPQVQAHLIRQLRARNVPDAVSRMVRLADRADDAVRAALRDSLPEVNLRDFMVRFDTMPASSLVAMGNLIRKLDAEAPQKLSEELYCASPIRRRRGVLAVKAMGLAAQMEAAIIERLDDTEQIVRLAAADALGDSPTARAAEALQYALCDRNLSVQEAARASLQRITAATAGADAAAEPGAAEAATSSEAKEVPA